MDSGQSGRVLLPLSQHANNTLLGISRMHPQNVLMVSPFCHEQPEGAHEVRGWCLDTPGNASASSLPVNCSMFDGVSIVKCDCTQSEILQLLSNAEDTRKRLGDAIAHIMQFTVLEETQHLRASWKRCSPMPHGVPQSLCSAVVVGQPTEQVESNSRVTFFNAEDCVPLIDSEPWIPELSPDGFVGLYHHWNHDDHHARAAMNQHTSRSDLYTKTSRGPSLYVVCQSYLPKACLEFADMVRDLGDSCAASEIHHSEEANWLRQACSRNRARVIATVCREMGIKVPLMLDYSAAAVCSMSDPSCCLMSELYASAMMRYKAITCIETLHHDMQSVPVKSMGSHQNQDTMMPSTNSTMNTSTTDSRELIRILNFCTPSSNTACVMAPWDGVWVFHGDSPTQDVYNQTPTSSYQASRGLSTTTTTSLRRYHEGTHFFPTLTPHIAEQDHHSLRHQTHNKRTFLMFTSNIPHSCEVLNVFFTRSGKQEKAKRASKKKLASNKSLGKIHPEVSESRDHALAILGTLDELRLALPTDQDTMIKILQSAPSDACGQSSMAMMMDSSSEPLQDPDITMAYKRSIARMASLLVPNQYHASSASEMTAPQAASSKTKTFLSFNENVLGAMERQGWKRSSGYTALIPLACGLCEHWKRFYEDEEAKRLCSSS